MRITVFFHKSCDKFVDELCHIANDAGEHLAVFNKKMFCVKFQISIDKHFHSVLWFDAKSFK